MSASRRQVVGSAVEHLAEPIKYQHLYQHRIAHPAELAEEVAAYLVL